MEKDFFEEVNWRGMVHDAMPGLQDHLNEKMRTAYVGIDPTADSLHIGHLVGVMLLKHFQLAGHRPVALIGGATGMIGDPSGKSKERNLLNEETLLHNQNKIKEQLQKFLNFSQGENAAILVNNYDWMKEFSFLNFIRDVGKHITVNYMMAKDSVKKRLSSESSEGMSFTEFTYQLVQGYDFVHLYNAEKCTLQMGGSDQWGNITTGTEMLRKMHNQKAFALTCPLITKADGTKFGKTEGGNIWLDPNRTSPYKFYQYWLNVSDEDAAKFIKIFTLLNQKEIESLIEEHQASPHLRKLQNVLADKVTQLVHDEDALQNAKDASKVLFGKSTIKDIEALNEVTFLEIFEGIPQAKVSKADFEEGIDMIGALAAKTSFLSSNSEAIRALKANSVSVNKAKVDQSYALSAKDLLNDKYILINKGKKNTYLIVVE
ncbi:tyrosine--tRNA ligase [Psychroflexus salis]|uniref:Tyrosine--tRNA ligase n=1 Tax=Psychroflexus salis TaxID=1526574 RepID=A0A917A059_9FLAO|nr:tyrosine--tRNA ligase [Psychroflexus salis]GGE20922.1 tyrosine--tRNA ligase [Psychroflexus salis]